MAGFNDLIPQAQPALAGGGCEAEATEGKDWEFPFEEIEDNNGDPIDMSAGVTAVAKVWVGPTMLVALDYTGTTDGTFKLTAPASATGGLANGKDMRQCRWSLEVIKGGKKVQMWSAYNSPFNILTAVGVPR